MSAWATVEALRELAGDLGVTLPEPDAACERLLEQAERDVQVYGLRTRDVEDALLTDEQRQALARAATRQAAWLVELGDDRLGPDGIASAGPIGFSREPRPRLSPEALSECCLLGLIRRAGTAAPEPPAAPEALWAAT